MFAARIPCSSSVSPGSREQPTGLFGSCGIYRIKGFAPQAVLLVEGQAVGWKGNVLAGIPEDDIRRVREASDLVSIRGSGSFCVSVAAISGVAARSITRNPPRSKSIRRRSCGIASAAAKAETSSAS